VPFIVYKVTNLVNGKFYIGVHKTNNPMDAYLGSGELIKRAVAKHGRSSFRKDILAVFDSPAAAFEMEEMLVAPHLSNPECYNMRKGGEGDLIISTEPG
jgi:hypothetical protein